MPICGYAFTDNLNSATVKGFEFVLDIEPVEGLNFNANVGYQNTSFNDSRAPIAQSGPPWTAVLSADYRREIGNDLEGYIRADYSYTDKPKGSSTDPLVLAALESNELVNARIGARFGQTDVSLFVNNVMDSQPVINPTRSRYIWQSTTFRPRTIGITASYRY